MLRIYLAVALALASIPAHAQEVSDAAYQLIDCGVVFLVHSDALSESDDTGGATEFGNLGQSLTERGAAMLVADGLDNEGIEDVLANLTLKNSFLYPGDSEKLVADCIAANDDSP